jgi:hypothetical protein
MFALLRLQLRRCRSKVDYEQPSNPSNRALSFELTGLVANFGSLQSWEATWAIGAMG